MTFEKTLYEDSSMIVGIEQLRVGGITIKLKGENASVHVRDGGLSKIGLECRPSLNVVAGGQTMFSIQSIAGVAIVKATATHEQ